MEQHHERELSCSFLHSEFWALNERREFINPRGMPGSKALSEPLTVALCTSLWNESEMHHLIPSHPHSSTLPGRCTRESWTKPIVLNHSRKKDVIWLKLLYQCFDFACEIYWIWKKIEVKLSDCGEERYIDHSFLHWLPLSCLMRFMYSSLSIRNWK